MNNNHATDREDVYKTGVNHHSTQLDKTREFRLAQKLDQKKTGEAET